MSKSRIPPAEFVAQMKREFPDFVDVRFNDALSRWEFVFLSVAGREVSQFYGWDRNPLTGKALEADPTSGLLPFRDLDQQAQLEIIDSCKRTYIGNRYDGAADWKGHIKTRRDHNDAVRRRSARNRAEDYAYALQQVDLRRPWLKYHKRNESAPIIVGPK